MSKASKALLWSLGHSLSYADLSLKAKIVWPILISECDEQGRFVADALNFKRSICPIIDEISIEDAEAIVSELHEQGMVLKYSVDGKDYGQILKWWEYQTPLWARRSKYPPPESWTDKIREKKGKEIIKKHWDEESGGESSGFVVEDNLIQDNIIQNNIIQYKDTMGIVSSSDAHTMNEALWEAIFAQLKNIHDPAAIRAVFSGAELAEVTEQFILVRVPGGKPGLGRAKRMDKRVADAAEYVLGRSVNVLLEQK